MEDEQAANDAALAALQRGALTHLVLSEVEFSADQAAHLAALRRLRTFAWAHVDQPLALGPWAGSLERLMTSANVAAGFLGVLPAMAPRLEALGLHCGAGAAPDLVPRLPGLALGFPGLRHLVLAAVAPVMGSLTSALLAVQRAAPRLRIDCIVAADGYSNAKWDALLTAVCGGPGHEPNTAEAFFADA